MPITLKIISYQRLTPGQQATFETSLTRFSIGRNPDNHWTLPDPQKFMSGTHCWLDFHNGAWFVTDTSKNGVYLNDSEQRLATNQAVALNHGDRFHLGDYELAVDLHSAVQDLGDQAGIPQGGYDDPFADDQENDPAPPQTGQSSARPELKDVNTPLSQMDKGLLGGAVSIDKLYELDAIEEEPQASLASRGDQVSPMREHFNAPQVTPTQASNLPDKYAADLDQIPDNWDEETGLVKQLPAEPPSDLSTTAHLPETRSAPPPMGATPEAAPKSGIPSDSALAAFAAGAGLDEKQLQLVDLADEEKFFHDLGALLKTMTEGLMQAIASRSQIKSEFRLEQTMIGPRENNPLKFSVSPQEALLRLINQNDKAYLTGQAAAAKAIDDINTHQLAVMAGTEAALKSILRRFRPASLEARFRSDSILSRAFPLLKKARYWEFYKALYNEISEAADDDFQQYFGAEFTHAYEQQLERLKSPH